MVNPPPIITTILIDTWVEADWEDFLTFADDPTLVSGRFYYDQGQMRIEMAPLGSAHGQDNTIISTVVNLYAAVKGIPIKGLTNTTFRKIRVQEAQPDLAFYVGKDLRFPPHNNSPVNLNELIPPTLVVEVAASSLEDDLDRKQKLYQRLGVKEYWVVRDTPPCNDGASSDFVNVSASQVIAVSLSAAGAIVLHESVVLPGLAINLVEEAWQRSQTEDDGAISRRLLATFQA